MAYPDISYGSKYNEFHYVDGKRVYRRASEISAAIRADIKQAVKDGILPGSPVKYSVTCENYSGGRSVNVKVIGLPDAWVDPDAENSSMKGRSFFYTEGQQVLSVEAARVEKVVQAIHNSYNYDGSDAMTDYYDVNYYGQAKIESQWEADWRVRQAAAKALKKAVVA